MRVPGEGEVRFEPCGKWLVIQYHDVFWTERNCDILLATIATYPVLDTDGELLAISTGCFVGHFA